MLSYEEYKQLNRIGKKGSKALFDFEYQNPATARDYKKRLESEKKKRSEIMSIENWKARHKAILENMALFGR